MTVKNAPKIHIPPKVLERIWWPTMRLVLEGFGSPADISTWTLLEVWQVNEALDLKQYVEAKARSAK